MALPQAQLGSMPSISLGGYIPAARKDPSVLEQALMAFLGGAAGTAGNRLVDKALPDPQRVASEKLARDKMTMDKEYNDAQLGLGRDRNLLARDELNATVTGRNEDRTSNDNNRKADRDQRDVEEARRTFLALQARLNDTSLAQAQAEGNEATRQEAMRLRAADEERTAAARNAELQARAPLTAAQARLLNAQAGGVEQDLQRMTPQNRSQAAGEALGIRPQPQTNLDLDELRAIQLEDEGPQKSGFQKAREATEVGVRLVPAVDIANRLWNFAKSGITADGPQPQQQAPATVQPEPGPTQLSQPQHQFTPEEVEAMVRRIEMLAQQPLSP
jgi:hypothetical protein